MATYVMCVRNDGYWLVGPFDEPPVSGPDRFKDFIDHGPANPKDDPRWQTVELDNPAAAPRVLTLTEHVEFVRRDRSPEMPDAPPVSTAAGDDGYSGVELDVVSRFLDDAERLDNSDVTERRGQAVWWLRGLVEARRG